METERDLIRRYFDAFNRHDLDAVVACFHAQALIVGSDGSRYEGLDAVRAMYAEQFAFTPDGRCDLQTVLSGGGRGVAESSFVGTQAGDGRTLRAIGAEVFEFANGRIKEIRVYHRPVR